MSVLVEGISVIVRAAALHERYEGGWEAFKAAVPNRTLCADGELVRVGFMSPVDVKAFVGRLEDPGVQHVRDGKAIDLVVVDQYTGPTSECDWIEFGHTSVADTKRVAACRLKDGQTSRFVTPDGWEYEGSLSSSSSFVPTKHVEKSLTFLRHEKGLDVYLNALTGKEVFIGRTGK